MLSIFRRGATSKIMLVILGIGLLAIVVTGFGTDGTGGIGSMTGGSSGDTLATVEGEKIGSVEATDQVNRQLSRMREQQPGLDIAAFLDGGALEEIVDQLITTTALTVFGRENGMAASQKLVDQEIASIPAFQNLAGKFDQQTFLGKLRQEGITEKQLRDEIGASLIQRQMLLPVAGSAQVPQTIALQYASLLLESRTGSVGIVPAQAMGPGREPSDAEVAAFYRENVARYTIPERRVLRYALFGREQVAAAATPTEAEIAAAYQANAAAYGAKETRALSQVVLPDEAAARAFAAKVAGGTSFVQAAAQAGFAAGDIALGKLGKDEFARASAPPIASAVFGAAKGATVGPIRSELGWHIVRVDDIIRTAGRPLAAVRGELAAQLGEQKANEALTGLATRLEEKIGEGASFEEAVRSEKLAVQETPPLTGNGAAPGVPNWQPSPELTPLLKTGFDMAPDEDPVVETIAPNERFALLAVGRVVPAAPLPLAQIRDQVKADLAARRAAERAKAVAASIVAKINAGVPPARAFAEAGVKLPAVQPVTARRMDIARQSKGVPPPLAMLFSLPKGKARTLAAPNGAGWFVVYLEKVVPGDARGVPQLVQATRSQFGQVLGDEYAQQFTRAVRAGMKVEKNDAAIRNLKTQLTRGIAAQ
jgi:peptidyl-prolyl cis-trans isomerase D